MGPFCPGTYAPHCCLHVEKRAPKALPSTASCQSDGPPSMQTLLASLNSEILKVTEQVYRGAYVLVPSILPSRQQIECMRELCQELTDHMARDDLQGKSGLARPTAKCRRCPHNHSNSWACSPSVEPQGADSAKWHREDTLVGWSRLRRCSHCRGRDRLRQL